MDYIFSKRIFTRARAQTHTHMFEDLKEEVVLDDLLYHQHPLILREARRGEAKELCSGCRSYISPEDTAYRCLWRDAGCWSSIHEECAEMPREIRLSIHPQHTLIQKRVYNRAHKCAVCDGSMSEIGYCCSDDSCEFRIHLGCAQNAAVVHAAAGGCIDHLSHPQHSLTLLWRPGRSASIRCDACATIHKGNSYLCIECQYCINESCATLLETTTFPHHHHPLSLAYHLPPEYIKFPHTCDICYKDFLPKYWLYHCHICRYAVHINCAIASPPTMSRINLIAGNAVKGVIAFPMEKNKVVEELILPYVMKNKLGGKLDLPMNIDKKYKFHNLHDHELSLISSASSSSSLDTRSLPLHLPEKENHENSDDDDLNTGIASELVCDGCTLPIHHKSCSSSNGVYYMSCSECKFFLHWACFHLPPELPSHPLHLEPDHNLTLESTPKLEFTYCRVCRKHTNGLFYRCTKCDFKLDIKCASLPDTIKHAAHPLHLLKLLSREITNDYSYWDRYCSACNQDMISDYCYKCDICRITLHASCIVLPAAVSNPSWDKHLLQLMSNDSRNNPIVFYCDVCEQEINPRVWMYHCQICDFSLHPRCFPTASGKYQNIKFGQRYAVAAEVHHHTLVFQLLTTKLRCDVCKRRKEYGSLGFQCDSHKCDFFMCLHPCGIEHLKK